MKNNLSKITKLSILLIALATMTSACSLTIGGSGSDSPTVDSSLFVSVDKGDTWRPITAMPSVSGRAGSIAGISVNALVADPQDNRAVYLASYEDGLFYTYDVYSGWNQVKGLPKVTVNDVEVDPRNKCIIYASLVNRVYRSSDCSRTWEQIYFDNNASVLVNALVVDHYNPKNLYIGTSRGEIIKSIDSGLSWRTIQRLDEGVSHLLVSPTDSRQLFVATTKNKIFSFTSNTNTNSANSADIDANFLVENWTDLNEVLKSFELGSNFKDIIINEKDGTMFIATSKVILRSRDNGFTWESLSLIQPEKEAVEND